MIDKDSVHLVQDFLQGDESVTERDGFSSMTDEEMQTVVTKVLRNPSIPDRKRAEFASGLWRILYTTRPPSPNEFLTEKYLGATVDDPGIYPHVREVFESFLDPESDKRVLALSTCIGFGKSTLSTLIVLYIIVCLSYMRNPKKFFGINAMGSFAVILMSFTKIKGAQVLLQPFERALESSPIFHRVSKAEFLQRKQKEVGPAGIVFTSAGKVGQFQFAQDIHITVTSKKEDILGLNVIAGIASEISFWLEKGVPIEEIWQTFTTLRGRINSRFGNRYLTATILDSSPLDLTKSPIDKWIYSGEASKDPLVQVVHSKHWDIFATEKMDRGNEYSKYRETGETFPVFRGDNGRSPKILHVNEVKNFSPEAVFNVPIDLYQAFYDDLKRKICDYCGYPAGNDSKFISDFRFIESSFYECLKNVYSYIHAPSTELPERLIWNQIKDKFFLEVSGVYEFYRYPTAPRYIHIDQAEVEDVAAISMVHVEVNERGERVIVADFTIPIMPTKERINLDAIGCFVDDLRRIGNIRIAKITADQWQSAPLIQRLKRQGYEAQKLSVDDDMTKYRIALGLLQTNRLKCGYNILLKNNWKSLVEVSYASGYRKIDHINISNIQRGGDEGWETSLLGYGQKDVTDSLVGAAFSCYEDDMNPLAYLLWEEPNAVKQAVNTVEDAMKKIAEIFKLQPLK